MLTIPRWFFFDPFRPGFLTIFIYFFNIVCSVYSVFESQMHFYLLHGNCTFKLSYCTDDATNLQTIYIHMWTLNKKRTFKPTFCAANVKSCKDLDNGSTVFWHSTFLPFCYIPTYGLMCASCFIFVCLYSLLSISSNLLLCIYYLCQIFVACLLVS